MSMDTLDKVQGVQGDWTMSMDFVHSDLVKKTEVNVAALEMIRYFIKQKAIMAHEHINIQTI